MPQFAALQPPPLLGTHRSCHTGQPVCDVSLCYVIFLWHYQKGTVCEHHNQLPKPAAFVLSTQLGIDCSCHTGLHSHVLPPVSLLCLQGEGPLHSHLLLKEEHDCLSLLVCTVNPLIGLLLFSTDYRAMSKLCIPSRQCMLTRC